MPILARDSAPDPLPLKCCEARPRISRLVGDQVRRSTVAEAASEILTSAAAVAAAPARKLLQKETISYAKKERG